MPIIRAAKPITDNQLPDVITRDPEATAIANAAINAHLAAVDPHLQYPTQARGDARYLRYFNSFEDTIIPPINLAANTWHELGNARNIGEQGRGSTWFINIYFQHEAPPGTPNQPYFQYCGAGALGAIFWQADLLSNQGIEIAMEAHNEADFTARIRFGRGQARKVELFLPRPINIASPGFGKISGVRVQ
jgi:hypothetical protein